MVVVYNSKLTRALIGAKRDALSDKPYAFSDKEREIFKEYERIATGRNRKVWSYAERSEALNQLYNDNKQYLSKNALNSLRGMNSEFSKQVSKRKVSDRDSVNRYLADLTVGANSDYFDIGKEENIELAEPITPVNRSSPQKKGFFGKIGDKVGEYVSKNFTEVGRYATGVAAGLLLFVNTSLISPNYISAEEPAQPKKVITIENKEPEKKTQIDEKPIEKPKPEEKKPEEKKPADNKMNLGYQMYDFSNIYGSTSSGGGFGGGNGSSTFRLFGSYDVPKPQNESEDSITRPKRVGLDIFGGQANKKTDGSSYDSSDFNYILGFDGKEAKSRYAYRGERISRETETTSDKTKQTVSNKFNGFSTMIPYKASRFTLQYGGSQSEDNTKVSIIQPILLDVRADVSTEEKKMLLGYDLIGPIGFGGYLSTANAKAEASVDKMKILDEKWDTWKLGLNLNKLKSNVAWYVQPNFTQGNDVKYHFGGDAFILNDVGKGFLLGAKGRVEDGTGYGSIIFGKGALNDVALYNKCIIDLGNDVSLTPEQKKIAENDYLLALARNSKSWLLDIGYNKQLPNEAGGLCGSLIIPVSNKVVLGGYGENGSMMDSYGTFAHYYPGESNKMSFDFGIGRENPDNRFTTPENKEGSTIFTFGVSIPLGGDNKKDGKDGKK